MAAIPMPFPECAVGRRNVAHFHLAITAVFTVESNLYLWARCFTVLKDRKQQTAKITLGAAFQLLEAWKPIPKSTLETTPKINTPNTALNMCKGFDVTAKSAPSLFLPSDNPEIPAHRGKEKIPWLYRTSQPLIYLQAEWCIRVKAAGEFQNWNKKLFYWYLFPIHRGFLMI